MRQRCRDRFHKLSVSGADHGVVFDGDGVGGLDHRATGDDQLGDDQHGDDQHGDVDDRDVGVWFHRPS